MIRYGFAYCFGLIVAPLVIPIVNRILIPTIKGLEITSAYEYVDRRFDRSTGNLASTLFVFRTLIWSGIIIYTASFAFSEISGLGLFTTIILLGVITTFYTSVGGFRTVIWTDNLQLWILLAGALSIPIYVYYLVGTGPMGWWETFSEAGRGEMQIFSFDPTVRITIVGIMLNILFWNICANGGDQVAIQRYLSTPSIKAAQRSVWVYAWSNVVLYTTLAVCGLALFAFYAISPTCRWPSFRPRSLPRATGSCRASSPSNFPPEYPAWSWRPCFRRPCPASARPSTPSPAS